MEVRDFVLDDWAARLVRQLLLLSIVFFTLWRLALTWGLTRAASALIAVWTSEARHLSSARRSPMSKRLRVWTESWVDVLRATRPGLTNLDVQGWRS